METYSIVPIRYSFEKVTQHNHDIDGFREVRNMKESSNRSNKTFLFVYCFYMLLDIGLFLYVLY